MEVGMGLLGSNQVACPVEVALPDEIGVLGTEHGGQMHHSGDPANGVYQA